MDKIFFDSWESIIRSFTITILAYGFLIFLLRISGKRTLSKMNAFDLVITFALGSSLATVALNKNVALADGILVFALLIFLQYAITWLSLRSIAFRNILTDQPILLLYKGQVFHDILKQERINMQEIHMAARKQGYSNLQEIDAIILEPTGDLNIMAGLPTLNAETMANVNKSDAEKR